MFEQTNIIIYGKYKRKLKRSITLIVSLVILVSGSLLFGGAVFFYPVSYAYSDEYVQDLFQDEYVQNQLIIGFKDISEFRGKEKQYRDEVEKVKKLQLQEIDNNTFAIKADDLQKNPISVVNRFKNSRFVEYVEPNYLGEIEVMPNDALYESRTRLYSGAINCEEGWGIATGGGPIIAIVDTGIMASHEDLPNLVPGYSAVSGDNSATTLFTVMALCAQVLQVHLVITE